MSEQSVFTLKYSLIHDEDENIINIGDPLSATQSKSCHILSFMMTFNPYQTDTKYKKIHMTCFECVQLPLYFYGVDDIIDTQIIKLPYNMLVHLSALDYERKPDMY